MRAHKSLIYVKCYYITTYTVPFGWVAKLAAKDRTWVGGSHWVVQKHMCAALGGSLRTGRLRPDSVRQIAPKAVVSDRLTVARMQPFGQVWR